jgi:purine-binding chemotaxis protein CheW
MGGSAFGGANGASNAPGFLVTRVPGRLCAFDLAHVVETMRPLPVEPMPGAPAFVLGLSLIRGAPTPVIDLAAWMGLPSSPPTRFVSVRSGARQVALAVTAVTGVRTLDPSELQAVPPLVQEAAAGHVQLVGSLDADLLVVLSAARLLPEESWPATEGPA